MVFITNSYVNLFIVPRLVYSAILGMIPKGEKRIRTNPLYPLKTDPSNVEYKISLVD